MTPGLLPPEWRVLLLSCAARTPETRSRLRQELDAGTLDWKRLDTCAREHDLGPRAYAGLRANGVIDAVPPLVRGSLQEQYFATAIRNTVLLRELSRLLSAFRSQGIPVILLKGASLAATIPGIVALRPMRDIDLLVPDSDVPAAERLFEASGYALEPDYQARRDWYRAHHYHLAFHSHPSTGPAIACEVHWQLERVSRPFAIDTEGLWARSQPVTVNGAGARALSPEDVLLHLCLHACKHRLAGGFRAFCDIADVIRGFAGQLDWTQLHARANEWRIAGFVYVPLWLTQMLLGASAPAWFMSALQPATVDESLLAAATAEAMTDRVDAALFAGFAADREQRARTLKTVFAPETVASRYELPPGSKYVYWYYPKRLVDVALAYGPRLWQFSRRPREVTARVAAQTRLAEWLAPFSDEPSV
jgi:hypothetical protein